MDCGGVQTQTPKPKTPTIGPYKSGQNSFYYVCTFLPPNMQSPGYFCPYQSQLTADSQPEVFIVYYNDCLIKVIMIEGLSIMPHDFGNFEFMISVVAPTLVILFYFIYLFIYYYYYYYLQFCDVAKRW